MNKISAVGQVEGIVARRTLGPVAELAERLRSYEYTVRIERHCGFWLVHWKFPEARKYQ